MRFVWFNFLLFFFLLGLLSVCYIMANFKWEENYFVEHQFWIQNKKYRLKMGIRWLFLLLDSFKQSS